jgi:PAS domain S-box-containing protein
MNNQNSIGEGIFWSIRWKTIFILTILFSIIFLGIFYWFYLVSTEFVLENLYSEMITVGRFAVSGLNGDLHQAMYDNPNYDPSLEWPIGMYDERYWDMSEWLYQVHQSNPRAYLYTYLSPEPGVIEFIVSHGAVLTPSEGASFRHRYIPKDPSVILQGLTEETISKNVIQDQWGSWVSGFIPLYNSENEIVAAVGVDYKADNIAEIQNKMKNAAIPAFFVSYLILVVVVILYSNNTVGPVISLSKAATQIGEGDLAFVEHKRRFFRDEISTLTEVFNGMAENVRARREHILTLYKDNVQRHEQERIKLAHDLHDEVLNGLAGLTMTIDDQNVGPQFHHNYKNLTSRIRQIIHGLRPPMLNHGLKPALEALIDELSDRAGHQVTMRIDFGESEERYDPAVENHLYRIVQQACENGLQHAGAHEIRISGEVGKNHVQVFIEDDGVGFSTDAILGRSGKVEFQRYGLVVMQERAELINANLQIDSFPGEGTRIEVSIPNLRERKWDFRSLIQAEAALMESEMTARGLMNATSDIVFLIDENGIILDANEALAKQHATQIKNLIGVCVWDLLPQEIAKRRKFFFDKAIQTRNTIRFEDERQNAWFDILLYPIIDSDGAITKVAISARDITDRKLAEHALQNSEENFRAIAENARDGILIANELGKHIYVNQRAADIIGYSIPELLETSLSDLTHPDEMKKITKRFRSRIKGEDQVKQYKTIILGKNGGQIHIELTAAKTTWNGRPAGMAIIRESSLPEK